MLLRQEITKRWMKLMEKGCSGNDERNPEGVGVALRNKTLGGEGIIIFMLVLL